MTIVPHPEILAAAERLYQMTKDVGAREITIAVRCDGTVELRSEDHRGFHMSTARFEVVP